MPSNLPGDLKPFLLQPSASTVDSILAAINYHVSAIDNLTNLTSVRGAKTLSGLAMETEQQTLNAKLNNMAAGLERIEVKIWKLFFAWNQVEMPEDFEVSYMKEFSIRDRDREIDRIIKAMAIVSNPLYQIEAQKELVSLTLDNSEMIEVIQQSIMSSQDPDGPARGAMTPGETHASAGEEPEQYVPHVEQMIRDGYSDAEILSMHPEVDVLVVDELRHQIES